MITQFFKRTSVTQDMKIESDNDLKCSKSNE